MDPGSIHVCMFVSVCLYIYIVYMKNLIHLENVLNNYLLLNKFSIFSQKPKKKVPNINAPNLKNKFLKPTLAGCNVVVM